MVIAGIAHEYTQLGTRIIWFAYSQGLLRKVHFPSNSKYYVTRAKISIFDQVWYYILLLLIVGGPGESASRLYV